MKLDELTNEELKKFRKAEKFYALISPADRQYEVVELDKTELEIDDYGDVHVLHEPEKYRESYWFNNREEAEGYVEKLKKQDQLVGELQQAVADAQDMLDRLKKRVNDPLFSSDNVDRFLE